MPGLGIDLVDFGACFALAVKAPEPGRTLIAGRSPKEFLVEVEGAANPSLARLRSLLAAYGDPDR
jgi:hypothetical protein